MGKFKRRFGELSLVIWSLYTSSPGPRPTDQAFNGVEGICVSTQVKKILYLMGKSDPLRAPVL